MFLLFYSVWRQTEVVRVKLLDYSYLTRRESKEVVHGVYNLALIILL